MNHIKGHVPKIKDGLVYDILREEDMNGAIDCIIKTFANGEPMTKAMGITEQEFQYFAEIFCKKAVLDGLSIIAKDEKSNKVMGSLICEDFVTDPPEGIERISPKFYPIMALLESLNKKFKAQYDGKKGEMLHQFMIGVLKSSFGRNVAFNITSENNRLAQLLNFSGSILEATGSISQHLVLNKMGYKEIGDVLYSDFEFEGKRIFGTITESESCKLAAIIF